MADINLNNLDGIPFGLDSGRPSNPQPGQPYFNGQSNRLEIYTQSVGWQNIVQETPAVVNVVGSAKETASSTITINGTNFAVGCIAYAIGTNGAEYQATTTSLVSVVQLTATFPALPLTYEPYDIKVVNPSNLYGILYDTLNVDANPVWTTGSGSLGTYVEQSAMSVQVSATDASDPASSALIYSISSGALPPGLSINSATGVISGTPENISSNTTYSFTASAYDGYNPAVTRNFSITVTDRGPTWVTSTTLPVFTQGSAYSTTLSATNDDATSISYSIFSGSLPTGLTLSSQGVISGTPTSSTNATFTIRATESGGSYSDRQFTMPNTGPVWSTNSIPAMVQSNSFSYQLLAPDDSGTTATFSTVSGSFPSGISMSSGGLLTGTPTASGTYSVTIRATDVNGAYADNSFSIFVYGSNLVGAFDASGTSITTSGSDITSWTNSVNSISATQSTSAYRPQLISNAQNGKSVARFNGNKWMSLNTNLSTQYIIAVSKPSGGEWTIESTDVTYTTNGTLSYSKLGGINVKWAGYGLGFSNTDEGNYMVSGGGRDVSGGITNLLNSNTFSFPFGNDLNGDPNPGQGKYGSALTVGTYNTIGRYMRCNPSYPTENTQVTVGGGSHFNGDLAEVLIFNSAVSASDLTTIVNYLKTKWNVNNYQPAYTSYGFNNSFTGSGSNPLTITGTNTSFTSTAKFGTHSLSLNGSNSYATIPFSSTINRVGTIAFWIYWKGHNSVGRTYLVDFRSSTYGNNGYWLIDSNNTMTYTSGSNELVFSHTPTTNTWEHYALVSDGFNVKFYKNGSLINTNTNSGGLVIQGNAYLGTYNGNIGGSGQYFANANIDNLYYSTYPASSSDISNLYNSQVGF